MIGGITFGAVLLTMVNQSFLPHQLNNLFIISCFDMYCKWWGAVLLLIFTNNHFQSQRKRGAGTLVQGSGYPPIVGGDSVQLRFLLCNAAFRRSRCDG